MGTPGPRDDVDVEAARLALSKHVSTHLAGSFEAAYVRLLRLSADTLRVARAGVWLFDEDRTRLSALVVYHAVPDEFGDDAPISMAGRAAYLSSLDAQRTVDAHDAMEDTRTMSLGDYLTKRRIGAMLDAGIFRAGVLVGVVCHEHLDGPRPWSDFERGFASSVADVMALLMEEADRLGAEVSLRETAAELQRKAELAELAAHVAHDFNNYLAVIRLTAGAHQGQAGLPPAVAESFAHVARAAEGASVLAQQLLGAARREPSDGAPVDVAAAIRGGSALWKALAGRHPVRLDVPREPVLAVVDESGLERVLLNLVANARDASAAGDPIDIVVRRSTGDVDAVIVEVRDRGVGMDEETRRRVIEPYFTTKVGGTGLGLAAAVGIVRQVRGDIEVISAPGEGTTVRLVLPAAPPV